MKKKVITIILTLILFLCIRCQLWFFNEDHSFSSLRNLYQYMELVELYEDIDLNFAEGEDNIYSYHFGVIKNDEGKVEELHIFIYNLDTIGYSQACDVMLATREYVETQEDFPYRVRIDFQSIGSGKPHGHITNWTNDTGMDGKDWFICECNIFVESCTELYEDYSMFAGYAYVYIEDVSDYEVLANWEGLERLNAYCGNTPEEIEQYNEALREMFPDGSVYIQTR